MSILDAISAIFEREERAAARPTDEEFDRLPIVREAKANGELLLGSRHTHDDKSVQHIAPWPENATDAEIDSATKATQEQFNVELLALYRKMASAADPNSDPNAPVCLGCFSSLLTNAMTSALADALDAGQEPVIMRNILNEQTRHLRGIENNYALRAQRDGSAAKYEEQQDTILVQTADLRAAAKG